MYNKTWTKKMNLIQENIKENINLYFPNKEEKKSKD